MRITIIGGTGLFGKALTREWTGDAVTSLGSHDVDIRSQSQIDEAVQRYRPEWIVLAAAYTDVDGCETNRELAFEVNFRGAVRVAQAASAVQSRLLFLSTDYVFDGQKKTPYGTDDPLAPKSVYGESKAQAEWGIRRVIPDCCIVRTSWVFGRDGKCFPETILKLAGTRKEIEVVEDQRGCPTYAVDLARITIELCRKGAAGTVHVTNYGDCTWFDFATEILRQAGLSAVVKPTTSDKFVRPAKRPVYSVLSGGSLANYGLTMPTWQDALRRYLRERLDFSRNG